MNKIKTNKKKEAKKCRGEKIFYYKGNCACAVSGFIGSDGCWLCQFCTEFDTKWAKKEGLI
jgi:hypothetical protein